MLSRFASYCAVEMEHFLDLIFVIESLLLAVIYLKVGFNNNF